MTFTLLYALLALIATAVNIGAQDLAVRVYHGPGYLPVAMVLGTFSGLMVKYVLDKKYIFRFQTTHLAQDGKLFVLYAAMGLMTTAIFWSLELAFHYAFETTAMRYAGGVLGLIIGYMVKFQLDKRFVFRR